MPTGQLQSPARAKRVCESLLLAALVAAVNAGCSQDAGSRVAVSLPRRAGEIWEVDSAASQSSGAAALLAFVSGTQVLLVDGATTYAGMRVTDGGQAPDGGQPLVLSDGISATLAPREGGMQLRFSSGEVLALRRRDAGAVR